MRRHPHVACTSGQPRESAENLTPVLKAYDEWTKLLPTSEIDHPARVYLIDRPGDIREIYSLAFFSEKQALFGYEGPAGKAALTS